MIKQFESKGIRFVVQEDDRSRVVYAKVDLGGKTGHRQRTIRYMPGNLEPMAGRWEWIAVTASKNDGKLSISFDGRGFVKDMIVRAETTVELKVTVKAIRIRPARRSRRTGFSVHAVEVIPDNATRRRY